MLYMLASTLRELKMFPLDSSLRSFQNQMLSQSPASHVHKRVVTLQLDSEVFHGVIECTAHAGQVR